MHCKKRKAVKWDFTKTVAMLGVTALLAGLAIWVWINPWKPVDRILQNMTLNEKICQMMIVRPEQLTGVKTVTAAGTKTKDALAAYPVGGILYSGKNLVNREQASEMLANIQSYSKLGLFLALDDREMNRTGVLEHSFSRMNASGEQNGDTVLAYAEALASERRQLGFNLELGPLRGVDLAGSPDLLECVEQGVHDGGLLCLLQGGPDEQGVVISAPLNNDGAHDAETGGDPVLALENGCDMLLDPVDLDTAIRAVKEAVGSADHPAITMERIDQSVRRILQAKADAGLLPR